MKIACVVVACLLLCASPALRAQRGVTFESLDKLGKIKADVYGGGARGVLLAHGGRFDEGSWRAQARALAASGFRVLALRFRGDRLNPDGSPSAEGSDEDNANDVLAGVAFLRAHGATSIAVVGASLGGDAAARAARTAPGSIERIVLLGSSGGESPEKIGGRKLFIVARDDRSGEGPRLPRIEANYAKATPPKKLIVVDGSAHAQFVFATAQGPRVLDEIARFLSAP
ncbi:MAG: alpha/beta hydrolase [Rudaea sp.]